MQSKDYIPNIDLSEIIENNNSKNIIKKIKLASEEIGFFTVTNHGIPLHQIENLLTTCKKFFYLPEEEKIKIAPKKMEP